MPPPPPSPPLQLRAIGFCGVEDSVDPEELIALSQEEFPSVPVEFGVLFRHDKAGTPRYATDIWVFEKLPAAVTKAATERSNKSSLEPTTPWRPLKLAAHLCGSRCREVLEGNAAGDTFLRRLLAVGFQRFQINATAVNGVDPSFLRDSCVASKFLDTARRFPEAEFIVQKNEETRPFWQNLIDLRRQQTRNSTTPDNISMLVDESKGTGTARKGGSWPAPPSSDDKDDFAIGYAGGIGPDNIRRVLVDIGKAVAASGSTTPVWIDMESSLRTINSHGKDVFDMDKCRRVVEVAREMGVIFS